MAITLFAAALLGALSVRALGWVPGSELVWLASGLTFALLAWLLGRLLLGWVAVACMGFVLVPSPDSDEVAHGGLARASLEIARGGCGERGCFAEGTLSSCSALEEQACLAPGTRLGVASDEELPVGRLTALVRIRQRARFENPGTSGWPDTRARFMATVQRGSSARIDHASWISRGIAGLRAWMRGLFERTLQAPHAGIARALLLGEGSAVEPALNDAIRNAGVSHVLAVSGMHVTLLVGAWVFAVQRLWLFTPWALHWEARRVGAALGAMLAPLLSRLCGASPSAARAACTSMLMYALTALGLRPSPLPIAALVVFGFAALEPREALHPGFLLSVLATAALLSDRRGGAFWQSAFRTSVRAWLSTLPFLWLCFGQLSFVALLANVALLPLGEALVPLAALHLIGGATDLLPTATLFTLASGAFVEASRLCAAIDPGLSLPPLTAVEAIALACFAFAWLAPLGWRTRAGIALAAALAACGSEWSLRLAADELRVTFLDVGQGDATLLESDGESILIDAGGAIGPGPDPGALSVLPALRARRIGTLDAVVLSHPHPDHFGGLGAVLAALPVRELWDNGQAEAEDIAPVVALIAQARTRGAQLRTPRELCDRPLALGRAAIEVLAPCPSFDVTREPNDNSFVLRVTHGQSRFLLTGDIEREAERGLLGRDLRAQVMKLGHHGSRSSSTQAFIDAVAPTIAIASAGRGNQFGHPHPEVIERLGARLLRTDLEGGIELISNGKTIRLRSARHPRWRTL